MALNFTDNYKTKIMNALFLNTALASPAQVYLALFLSDPGPEGSGTEVSGNGYVRMPIPWGAVVVDPTTHEVSIANSAVIQFPKATGNWGTIGWNALMDAQSGGAMIASAALVEARQVFANDTVAYEANSLKTRML